MLDLERDGAELAECALSQAEIVELRQALNPFDLGLPGTRISELHSLQRWIGRQGTVGRIVAKWLGAKAAPVRAILFDKNDASNWALGWHQDRTIAVDRRADVTGFANWNRKAGVDHVEPPFELIERMITARIHLDPVPSENAPLLISPTTHQLGKIAEDQISTIVERNGAYECLAEAGDIWFYRTAIVHASKRSASPKRRRVLQVDFSADTLPEPLNWKLAG